jgi:putative inorganic carbon (hco3(-)) transporter
MTSFPYDRDVTVQTRAIPRVPASVIVGSALLAAVIAGLLLGNGRMSLALGVVLAAAYIPLVFLDLAAAIAFWAGLLFIAHLYVLGKGPTAIGILLVLAWFGAASDRRRRLSVLWDHRWLTLTIVVFGCWLTLSIAWAEVAGRAAVAAGDWWTAALVFVIVATTLTRPRDVRFVALAFVIGSVVAVTLGFLGVGGPSNPAAAAAIGKRLEGAGDPNYQAAAFLGAMFLTGGLISVFRRSAARIGLSLALAVITVGFFATESRGGLLALGLALLAAFGLFPQHRGRILGLAVIAGMGLAVWLPSRPDALHRLTHFGASGSGRQDEWTVAWRIFSGHPLVGVGLSNFQVLEPRYVLQPGNLTHVQYVSETPKLVHNAYLQLLAETGLVGLVAFLLVALGSLRASWLAARHLDALGQTGYANLARAVLIGTIGMLAAMFFISDGQDSRLWILFALGPVLLTLAKRWPVDADTPSGQAVPGHRGGRSAQVTRSRSTGISMPVESPASRRDVESLASDTG